MMNVRKVRVSMFQRLMAVRVGVRFASIPLRAVRMLMMKVVNVGMGVIERFMAVQMLMSFSQVKPYPDTHHHARQHQAQGERRSQYHSERCAEKGSH